MKSSRNEDQKGQSIIIVAFLFLALIILAAIAVDVTSAYFDRRVAQNAADAAALAAAQELGHHLRGESTTNADVLYQLDDFAQRNGAQAIVRGLRMSADFEREFEMAMMNKKLSPGIDVICLMADLRYQILSSSLLKEVADLDGDINDLVPKPVAEALRRKFLVKP